MSTWWDPISMKNLCPCAQGRGPCWYALPVLARGDISSKLHYWRHMVFMNIYACNYTHIPKVVLFHGPLYCHGPFCFKLGTDTWQWYGTSLFHAYQLTLYGNIQVTLYSAKGVDVRWYFTRVRTELVHAYHHTLLATNLGGNPLQMDLIAEIVRWTDRDTCSPHPQWPDSKKWTHLIDVFIISHFWTWKLKCLYHEWKQELA